MTSSESWGRYPKVSQQEREYHWRNDPLPVIPTESLLPIGQRRSYGDCCLNDEQTVVTTSSLNKFISFDRETGVLCVESGVTLAQILQVIVPAGWFIPVSPGTKFVSVGGAIANDIHGKNHHREGTFGCHVRALELLRSDGERFSCSSGSNPELFRATIGGLGLTGLIVWAEIQLKKIAGPYIDVETIKFESLDEFLAISHSSDKEFEYTVAWVDCVHQGASLGRGHFMRGNHSSQPAQREKETKVPGPLCTVPFDFPSFALNQYSVKAFNFAYYHRQRSKKVVKTTHYDPFFYPLDRVLHWNRIYGRRGFLQFQCVVPKNDRAEALHEIFQSVVDSGSASFLAVIKEFGTVPSPGMLSFPQEGVTLCMDFPYEGGKTLDLFRRLDQMVFTAGGRLYPAKDACMKREHFEKYYPQLTQFRSWIDPKFSSSLWRRLGQAPR